jgi:hypothetical protein
MTNATETERPSPNVIDAKTFWRTLGAPLPPPASRIPHPTTAAAPRDLAVALRPQLKFYVCNNDAGQLVVV